MRVSKVGVEGRCFPIHFSLSTLHTVSTYLITLLSMYLQLGAVTPTYLGVATKESQLISGG